MFEKQRKCNLTEGRGGGYRKICTIWYKMDWTWSHVKENSRQELGTPLCWFHSPPATFGQCTMSDPTTRSRVFSLISVLGSVERYASYWKSKTWHCDLKCNMTLAVVANCTLHVGCHHLSDLACSLQMSLTFLPWRGELYVSFLESRPTLVICLWSVDRSGRDASSYLSLGQKRAFGLRLVLLKCSLLTPSERATVPLPQKPLCCEEA